MEGKNWSGQRGEHAVDDEYSGRGDNVVERAQLRKKSQLTLPSAVRDALHLSEGDEVEFTVLPDGDVVLRGMTTIPADQKWFWEESWQAGERQASEDIATGNVRTFDDLDDMFAALD